MNKSLPLSLIVGVDKSPEEIVGEALVEDAINELPGEDRVQMGRSSCLSIASECREASEGITHGYMSISNCM